MAVKQVRKYARKRSARKSPRATVATVNHKPGAHQLAGSEERRSTLMHRALRLKIEGYTLCEIANALVEEFNLTEAPVKATIHNWIEEAMEEGRGASKRETENYIAIGQLRSEAIIRRLIPFACGNFLVERKKMVDGEEVIIIEEQVLKERIAAAAEVRKQIEMVAKLRGVNMGKGEDGAVSADGMKTFIIQTVNNFARQGEAITSERAQKVLELEAGDADIDSL